MYAMMEILGEMEVEVSEEMTTEVADTILTYWTLRRRDNMGFRNQTPEVPSLDDLRQLLNWKQTKIGIDATHMSLHRATHHFGRGLDEPAVLVTMVLTFRPMRFSPTLTFNLNRDIIRVPTTLGMSDFNRLGFEDQFTRIEAFCARPQHEREVQREGAHKFIRGNTQRVLLQDVFTTIEMSSI